MMFNKIKNIFGLKEVKSFGSFDSSLGGYTFFGGSNSSMKLSNAELIKLYTGYSFVCVNATAEGIAGLDRKLLWSENRVDREKEHKYSKLITNSFLIELVGFLEITGTAYIKKEMFGKSIESLKILRTDRVSAKRDSNGNITYYEYNVNGKIIRYSLDEIFVIKHFSPFMDGEGIGPLSALGKQQSMDEAIINWNWSFFKNNASTGTTLTTDQDVDSKKKQEIINKWKSEFMGAENAHKVAILDRGLTQKENKPGQKDMDFVQQRIMIRDEIFTIFRVPKVIVGITDGIGYTDRKVGEENFAKFKLKPIAVKIQEALNENVFEGNGYFTFMNIIPVDNEQLAEDYRLGVISKNEYRLKRNYLPIKLGNKTIDGEEVENEDEKGKSIKNNVVSETVKKAFSEIDLKKIDLNQKRWEAKVIRTNKDEKEFNLLMSSIFALQEKDILKLIEKEGKKSIEEIKEEKIIDDIGYLILFQKTFKPFFRKLVKREGAIAIKEVGNYNFSDSNIDSWIGENIKKFALEINMTTRKEIIQIIKNGVKDGAGTDEINRNIKDKFKQYSISRVNKISRTEITRGVSYSRMEAWGQTGVVKYKEWWTAGDERVSTACKALHGKKIRLGDNFYNLGDTDSDGKKVDYEDVAGPPKHTNCRCDLIPIID